MKNSIKLAFLATLMGAVTLTAQAQTNLVEELGVQLTVISQGVPITNKTRVIQNADVVRLGTKDVIGMLGAATTNKFSRSAQLLRVTPIIDGTNGPILTVIKDGTNIVDVSGFFAFSTDGNVVRNSTSNDGKLIDATRFNIRTLALKDQAGFPSLTTHFDVQGFNVSVFHRVVLKDGLVVDGHYANWTVNGTGNHNGKPTVDEGNVSVNFLKVDVTGGY